MAYTPYDWQQTLRQKGDYVEDRLLGGSPVVAMGLREGILLLTTRRHQRKIFEIYDRLAFAGLGNPSDLEAIRQQSVDFAHSEGYQRAPEDVSIQRVVGFAISPVLKRFFADPGRAPLVIRGVFAQVGRAPEDDLFYLIGYDGEFTTLHRHAAIAGAEYAELQMDRVLSGRGSNGGDAGPENMLEREEAIVQALRAWAAGHWAIQVGGAALTEGVEGEEEPGEAEELQERMEGRGGAPSAKELDRVLAEALEEGGVRLEAAVLERDPSRERKLRYLSPDELAPHLSTSG